MAVTILVLELNADGDLGKWMMLYCFYRWGSSSSIYAFPKQPLLYSRHRNGATHRLLYTEPEPHSVCRFQVERLVAGIGAISRRVHILAVRGLAFFVS